MGAAMRTRPVQRRWAAAGCSLSPARPVALPPLRLQAPSMLSIFGTRHDGTSDAMRAFGGLAAHLGLRSVHDYTLPHLIVSAPSLAVAGTPVMCGWLLALGRRAA